MFLIDDLPGLREQIIREAACPQCDAQPGERCDGEAGPRGCHLARWEAYLNG